MQFYNKDDVYQEDIVPLLEEIVRICEQHSIQWTAVFQTQARPDGVRTYMCGRYINDDDFPAGVRLSLANLVATAPDHKLHFWADGLIKKSKKK